MRKHIKSPFILATTSGIGALIADAVWLTGELSTHFGVITETTYLMVRFGILAALIISVIIAALAIRKYLKNGYVRAEHTIEMEHKCYLKQLKINRKIKNNSGTFTD